MSETTREDHDHLCDQLRKVSGPVKIELSSTACLMIAAQIQLALRHPDNTGPGAEISRAFVVDLIQKLPIDNRAKRLMFRGFDPNFDEPIGG